MKQIRRSVFETNSSSTHSFTLKKEITNEKIDFKSEKIKIDSENNIVINFIENHSCGGTVYYEGFSSKLSYILLLLINGLDIILNYEDIEYTLVEDLFNFDIFKPLEKEIKDLGYKGIKIERNLDVLDEDEKLMPFYIEEIIHGKANYLDSDNFIKNIEQLEKKFELSLKEILTNNEIILVEIDRDYEDRIDYTYHSKYIYKKMKEKENETN